MAGRHHERRGLLGVAYRRLTRRVTVALLALALLTGLGVATLLRRPDLPPPVMMSPGQAPTMPIAASTDTSPTAVVLDVSVTPPPPATAAPACVPAPPRPAPSRTEAAGTLSIRCDQGNSWDTGFIGGGTVTNTGTTPQHFQAEIGYPAAAGVRVTTAWNADLERADGRTRYRGGPLAPGATRTFGFEATKTTADPVRPDACTVSRIPE